AETPAFRPAAYNGADGTFELRDVAPGSYWIQAQALPESLDFQLSIAELMKNMARVPADVGNADLEGVVVTFMAGLSLRGRVEIEKTVNTPPPGTDPLMLSLEPQESTVGVVLPQAVKPDGTIVLESVVAGDYRIQIGGGPRNLYLKSAHLGRTDVLNRL